MKLLRACYDPRVIAGLVAVAIGIFLFAPGAIVVAAPFLFLAVCPLSMLVMMRTMGGMHAMDAPQPSNPAATAPSMAPGDRASALRLQLAAKRLEQQQLADELAQLQNGIDPARDAPSSVTGTARRAAEAP